MSNTLKRASVRVVNLMGNEDVRGMQRLPTRDSDSDASQGVPTPTPSGPNTPIDELHPAGSINTLPIGGLRGRTLCLFTSRSRIRKALDKVLLYPYVVLSKRR